MISLSMGVKNIRTQKAKLLAQHDEPGGYIVYVFENLDYILEAISASTTPNIDKYLVK